MVFWETGKNNYVLYFMESGTKGVFIIIRNYVELLQPFSPWANSRKAWIIRVSFDPSGDWSESEIVLQISLQTLEAHIHRP